MPILLGLWDNFKKFCYQRSPRVFRLVDRYQRFIKFFLAGFAVTIINLFLLFILHGIFKIAIVPATSLSFVVSFVASFYVHKFFAFTDYSPHYFKQFCLHVIVAVVNLNINGLFMHILVNEYHVWYLFSQLLVDAIIGIDSFLLYKFVIFKNDHYETTNSQN
jgi:putative flippase GtrA